TPLTKLAGLVGEKNAVRSYQLCLEAIDALEKIGRMLPEAGFTRKPSLQYASFKKDVAPLKQEYDARKKMGISLQWLDRHLVTEKFGFHKEAAILSKNAAQIKAYALTHALLQHAHKK